VILNRVLNSSSGTTYLVKLVHLSIDLDPASGNGSIRLLLLRTDGTQIQNRNDLSTGISSSIVLNFYVSKGTTFET
jgi:hypothetical protein